MSQAFQGRVPVDKIKRLKPGDVLLVQTLGSWISWLIMYLTSSEISHVASYVGDGQIVHATSGGVVKESIESLFGERSRVLLTKGGWPDEVRREFVSHQLSVLGTPYGWSVVFYKAYLILSARDWNYFRWKFAADIAFILIILDIALLLILHKPVISWLVPAYIALVLFHAILWKFSPLRLSAMTAKPQDMLTHVLSTGGVIVADEENVAKEVREELALLQNYARERDSNPDG